VFEYDLPGECRLRLLEESDAEALVRVIETNRAYLAEWLPWVEATPNDVETRRDFIRRARQQVEDDNGFQAAIVDVDEIIGVVGFHGVDWKNRSTSIGYARRGPARAWNHDRGCEGPHTARLGDLEAQSRRDPRGNRKFAQRSDPEGLGFTEEGVLRQAERHRDAYEDVAVFALLARDREKALSARA
jgi:ribosomal-protein-serine acetyltransferase